MPFINEIISEFQNQQLAFVAFVKHNLKNPSFTNVYYCVLLAYLFCFFLEVILPKQRKHGLLNRKFFWQDTFYVLFNDLLIYALGFFALCAVSEFIFLKFLSLFNINSLTIVDIKTWNPLFQVLIMFLIQDFCEFIAHILLHRSNFLWKFHKIHHAQEELGAASTRHFHFLEMCVFKPIIYLPFAMIGYSVVDYFLFQITVQNVWGFFTHCNIKVKWGILNYIINTPETHAWHHAKNIPNKYGVNYASILNIWDLLFGYFYLPKDKSPILGVENNNVPKSFLGQLIYPFKKS
ncbi:MAG: sterol desaturase family protein [Bacteroidota bacterium]|jgi:sterol desaturase/sphingolipid hydroxylase (fatty acid hydroxylase superfamily)|nr:sterol desaturase family protein [Bacteroidota bacterium]MCA6441968.1 sterol desaturase family protein [Bacteroidota bacterium]